MLSDLIEYNQEVCYPYWPKVGSEDYGDYNVEFMKESTDESLNTREFTLICTSKEVIKLSLSCMSGLTSILIYFSCT